MSPTTRRIITILLLIALIITAGMAVYLNLQLKKQEKQSSAGRIAGQPTQKPETGLRPVRSDRFSMLAKQAVSAHDLGILRFNKGELTCQV